MAFRTVALLCLLCCLFPFATALVTKIEAKTEVCFTEYIGRDIPLSFTFQVTAGGKLDLDVTIYDATGRKLTGWTEATEGHYNLRGDAANPKFKFCFSNLMARFTPKWVNFYFHKGQHPAVAKPQDLDPVERSIMQLSQQLDKVVADQAEMRRSEHDHRNTIEDVNERMLLWSVFECVALLVAGGFQLFFLKRFLEVRSSV